MRLNPDPQIQDIKLINPQKLSIVELRQVRSMIYAIRVEELIRCEEGKKVLNYLTAVNKELSKKVGRAYTRST